MQAIGLIFFLAVLVEGIIEYFGAPIPKQYKAYVAAAFGIVVCLAYSADLPALLGFPAVWPYVGQILTGFVIGRGSNYANILISRAQVVQVPAAPVTDVAPPTP